MYLLYIFFLSYCCTAMWNLFKVRSVGTFLTASVPVSLIRCGLINKRTVSHFWSLTRWPDARMCILSDAAIKKYRNTCHSSFPCFQPSYLRALKSFFFFNLFVTTEIFLPDFVFSHSCWAQEIDYLCCDIGTVERKKQLISLISSFRKMHLLLLSLEKVTVLHFLIHSVCTKLCFHGALVAS